MAQDISPYIPEIWSKKAIVARDAALVMGNLVDREYESELSFGDTLNVPSVSDLSTSNVPTSNDGTEITFQELSEATTQLLVNNWKTAAFRLNKKDVKQAMQRLQDRWAPKAGYALAKAQDTALLTLTQSLSTNSVGSAGVDITDANFRLAIQKLDDKNAPEDDRHFVIKPSQKNALLGIDKFVEADKVGTDELIRLGMMSAGGARPRGFFGQLYGVNIWVTTQVTTTGTSPISTYNVLFHRSAFALVTQLNEMPFTPETFWFDPDEKCYKMAPELLYGVKTMRDDHAVKVLT